MASAVGVADYTKDAASPAQSEVFRTLFVYGPLMADEVLSALLTRVPRHRPATLTGFARCCKRGADQIAGVCSTHRGLVAASYPAAVRTDAPGHQIEGLLLERLRPQELRCLDHYEDPSYQQTQVTVTANSGFGANEPVSALIYAWPSTAAAAEQLDIHREWSYTEFRTHHMARFIESVVKSCRASFERQEGALEVVMTDRSHRPPRAAP
jgi:gamma-glutamylcyclotransferase (GGCT)/AIG2-like uncharacterized protein YtfP